jgi:hypothetical protein
MGDFDYIVAALHASPPVKAFMEMAVSNDYSLLDRNAAKRHHFLSQFLLRGFAYEDNGNRLFQMETTSRRVPLRVDLRTAASRHRLYVALDEQGRPSNRNEGYLALVEQHAAPALRRMMDDPSSLSPGERATIAFFVALQTMRTPAAAEQVASIANAAFRTTATESFSDRRAFAERYRELFDEGASEEEIERFRLETLDQIREGKVRASGKDGAAFGTALQHAVENVPMLIAFDWTLLRARGGGLITSDRGYAIHDPTPPYPWTAQGLLSSENSETTVPLSDECCLLMRPVPASSGLTVSEISTDDVETLNLRMYGWAEKYVFAKTQGALAAVRIASRRRPGDVIRPKPFCQVALVQADPNDGSLAEANRRRGWPAQLCNAEGELCDYIVIPTDKPHADLWKLADEMTERRARKRADIGPDEPVEGRIINKPLHPLDISH